MRDRFRTVKSRVIMMMILFALVVTVLVSAFSFYLMYLFQRKTTVQSTEFNLQLVASVIEQDLLDLTALGKWCGTNSQITDYFLSDSDIKANGLQAYNRLLEEFLNCRAYIYVRRLVVVNDQSTKILQVGNSLGYSSPITIYNVEVLKSLNLGQSSEWQRIVRDPFFHANIPGVIPLTCPVYNPADRSPIGSVFLAASTDVITDKLKGYALPEKSSLYLTLGEHNYLINGKDFTPEEQGYEVISRNTKDPTSPNTLAAVIRMDDGEKYTIVSYPVRDGIALTQVLSEDQFMPQRTAWFGLLLGLCILILLLAVFITYSLDVNISMPVARLHKKIIAIAQGDFSPAPELESDTELGLVGKGINRLSKDVVALMNKRIADEKQQRDLEYQMLLSQINPHFIYNTLNSIKWMATIQNATGIAEMTTAFAHMLKNISKSTAQMIPLREELALINDYFFIQSYRYGGAIKMESEIESDALCDCLIPRFSLQPLVENAIFHGIEPKGGTGKITLRVYAAGDDLTVEIIDDGVGMSDEMINDILIKNESPSGLFKQVGIHNVHERIRYAFGAKYGITISSTPGQFTSMSILLPKRTIG